MRKLLLFAAVFVAALVGVLDDVDGKFFVRIFAKTDAE